MRKKRLLWQLFFSYLWVTLAVLLMIGIYRTSVMRSFYIDRIAPVVATAAILWVSLWLSRRISRPLEEMTASAQRFASGDLEYRLPTSDTAEISTLAEAMNQMAEELDERIRTISRQQNEQEAMFLSMNDGVLAVDCEGTILNLNEACARLLHTELPRLKGRKVHEVIRKPDLLGFVEAALAGSEPIEGTVQIHDTEDRILRANGTTLHDAKRQKIGALVVMHDMTRLHRLENVRRDFVANVSHELRTPITSIKGFVETLLDGAWDDPENCERFLKIVLRQVNRLNAIIEDLLILSRIERGSEEHTVHLEPDSIREMLEAALQMCQKKAEAKGVHLDLDCVQDLTAEMNAHLLEQAVVNLIDNAIKYSQAGMTVYISAVEEAGNVVVRVKDEGCGIEATHLPRLFERFYRVDKARSRELGGTGLGLAIVKHIILAHRGEVEVESRVRRGTTFSIRIPATAPKMVAAGR